MLRTIVLSFLLLSVGSAADPAREQWLSVADKLVATPAESYAFNWGEGVMMSGLMQVYERTRNPAYAAFVEKWAGFHIPKGIEALLGNTPDSKRRGYCGHWVSGTVLLYLYEVRAKPEYLKTASQIAQFIRAGATRSPEGAVGHWQGNYQIWVDTLNMVCPLLSRLSRIENRPDYLEDAVNQLLVSARHMQDARTRLFYHMWDWEHGRRSPVQWGRGNGWVTMSLADTFEYLPKNHRLYKPLRRVALEQAKGLVEVQTSDGLWRTIMDDQGSYAECSATAMVAYGLLKMVRLGVLPARYRQPARRAWAAVNERWVRDGVVTGVSAGTAPLDKEAYLARPQGTYTWGTGAYLLAGSEIDRQR